MAGATVSGMTSSGAAAFDFIHGTWAVHNRKRRDVADPACDEWVEFGASSEVVPVLQGVGHLDRMTVPDPSDEAWRIWWSSSRAPGRVDPPLVGRFSDGLGVFEGEDVVAGRPIRLRFEWRADPSSPRWEQSFSYDGGVTWTVNWVMAFTRTGEAVGQGAPSALLATPQT